MRVNLHENSQKGLILYRKRPFRPPGEIKIMPLLACFIGYIVTRFTWLGVGETEPIDKISTD